MVVSSGLHGVEGFFGSAIQISCLAQLSAADLQRSGGEFVFIHAINPFGFSELRRVNEYNIDLNRNFVLPGEAYAGASAEYAALNGFLNPSTPPRLFDPYLARACWTIARLGLPALKQAVAEGQYSYPNGIFFGGHQPARSTAIIRDNMMRWSRGRRVVHLDLHSGLGKYAAYKLLAPARLDAQELAVYRQLFGTEHRSPGAIVESRTGCAETSVTTCPRWQRASIIDLCSWSLVPTLLFAFWVLCVGRIRSLPHAEGQHGTSASKGRASGMLLPRVLVVARIGPSTRPADHRKSAAGCCA